MDTSAQTLETPDTPAIKPYARFQADRLRWVYAARAKIFDARTYLQKVLIEPAPDGGVYLVATNGALLMVAFDAEGTASHRFTFDPLEEIANICGFPDVEEKLFGNSSYADTIVIEGTTLTACRGQLETLAGRLIKVLSQEVEIGEEFPGWKALATHRGPCNPTTAFIDITQLELALTGLADTPVAINFTRYVRDGHDAWIEPVHIAFERLPLRGVLMPVKNPKGKPLMTRHPMPFDAA